MNSPGTSGPAEDGLTINTELPLFIEPSYYGDSLKDPVYQLYSCGRSKRFLLSLDDIMTNLFNHRRDNIIGGLPNLEVLIETIGIRRRVLLLEDVLFLTGGRPDLDALFLQHRIMLTTFMHKLRLILYALRRHHSQNQGDERVQWAVNFVVTEFHTAYDDFSPTMLSYNILVQEAFTWGEQTNSIPDLITPYLEYDIYRLPSSEVVGLLVQCKAELLSLKNKRTDWPYVPPTRYIEEINFFLENFPIQYWTQEYILFFLNKIKQMLQNYYQEEMIKELNIHLYMDIIHQRDILKETIRYMSNIQAFYRYFLQEEFRKIHHVTPKDYLFGAFNDLLNHEQKYRSALQQGIIKIAQTQPTERLSRDKQPGFQ